MSGSNHSEPLRAALITLDAVDVLKQLGLSRAKWLEAEHAAADRQIRATGA